MRIRTYPIKSLTIFLAVCFTVSLSMVILFAFLTNEEPFIRILIFLFCGAFTIISGIVLAYQLFFYVAVDEEHFTKYFIFGYYRIPFKKIQKVVNRDGFYEVMVNGKKFASFTSNTKQGQQIIVFLEKKGVKIDW